MKVEVIDLAITHAHTGNDILIIIFIIIFIDRKVLFLIVFKYSIITITCYIRDAYFHIKQMTIRNMHKKM